MDNYVFEVEKQYKDMVDRATQLIHMIGAQTSKFDNYDIRLAHNAATGVYVYLHKLPEKSLEKVIEERDVLGFNLCILDSVLTAVMK